MQHAQQLREKRREAAWTDTQSVLIAIGNITISWAGINLILNRFIEAYQADVGPVIRRDMPRSFDLKIDYLKKAERDARWAPDRCDELRQIRIELAQMNEFRVNLVHGLLVRHGYGPNWRIHIAKETGDKLARWNVSHTSDDIHAFSAALSDIGGRMSLFFMPLITDNG